MIPLLLALVAPAGAADASAEPVAREVRTTTGARRICWDPPPASTGLDGPVDRALVVAGTPVWGALRCVDLPLDADPVVRWSDAPEAEGSTQTDAQGEGSGAAPAAWTVEAPGPLRWHGPAVEPPLLPGDVQQVKAAADGALWLARCDAGVTRLHPERRTRLTWTVLDGLPPGCVTQVAPTPDGGAWALTPDRAVRLDPDRGPVEIVEFDPLDRASVGAVLVTGSGTVWLGGQGGRLRSLPADGEPERRYVGSRLGALDRIAALGQAADGALWISSRDRITRLDPATGRFTVRVAHGERPGVPPGRPGPVVEAADGAWVVVRPERPGAEGGGLVQLLPEGGFARLELPGVPDLPLALTRTSDDALWVADGNGIVRISPARDEARRVAVRQGFVPGGPWVVPATDDTVWAAFEGGRSGATLTRLGPTGARLDRLAPDPLPAPGALVRADDSVLLATSDGLWTLDPTQARWTRHPGFGEGLRGWSARRLSAIHTGPTGTVWLAGADGLRVGRPSVGFQDATPPGASAVSDVHEDAGGTTTIAADVGLFARDRLGRVLRVVDDRGRAVTGAEHLEVATDGRLWAWGPGGAWVVEGSDAERRLGGPVHDLVATEGGLWAVRGDVRRLVGDRFDRVELPWSIVGPRQVVVRDGQPVWVRDRSGLWRREGGSGADWVRAVGVDGPFQRSRDGTLWRWDPDGLHVLPPAAITWRWVGLPRQPEPALPEDEPARPPIAADSVVVHAIAGALAVEVEGRLVGDPLRADPIVDLDVRGTRWAALSRRGVLLRGDGYRVLERSHVPGPARRVAVGPRQVCVAGTVVWCRSAGRWSPALDVFALPAPLPAVDLAIDEDGRAWSLHPGALCRQGEGCRGVPGVSQTSLALDGDVAWVGALEGLYRVRGSGRERVWDGAPVRDLDVAAPGVVWLATEGKGLVRWSEPAEPGGEPGVSVIGLGHDPLDPHPQAAEEVAVSRTGHVWVRQGRSRLVRPGPTMRLDHWPWAR